MRAFRTLIMLCGLLAIAGMATAQNDPCPECDEDGTPAENSYHSVDVGAIVENETGVNTDEVLVDTDVAHSHDDHPKGFWLWLSLCVSAFLEHIEDAVGIHTDVDAHAEVYADSEGVDVDASVHGVQYVCTAVGAQTACDDLGANDVDFDDSPAGDVDGMTYEAVATVEATTGVDVFVPAALPDTSDTDLDLCVYATLDLC